MPSGSVWLVFWPGSCTRICLPGTKLQIWGSFRNIFSAVFHRLTPCRPDFSGMLRGSGLCRLFSWLFLAVPGSGKERRLSCFCGQAFPADHDGRGHKDGGKRLALLSGCFYAPSVLLCRRLSDPSVVSVAVPRGAVESFQNRGHGFFTGDGDPAGMLCEPGASGTVFKDVFLKNESERSGRKETPGSGLPAGFHRWCNLHPHAFSFHAIPDAAALQYARTAG